MHGLKIVKRFISLERLEKSWGKRLKGLNNSLSTQVNNELSLYCEQFLVNSIYRFICEAEDVAYARAVVLACLFAWWIINSIYQNEGAKQKEFESICDIVREYSAEVEYSQKNQNKLFDFAYSFVKI